MNKRMREIIDKRAGEPELTSEAWLAERYENTSWVDDESGRKAYFGHLFTEDSLKPGRCFSGIRILFFANHPRVAMREIVESGCEPGIFAHKVLN